MFEDLRGRLGSRLLRTFEPETAHQLAIQALRSGVAELALMPVPFAPKPDDPVLASDPWGLPFPNPVGLAAGFDKNAEVHDAMLRLGFGFVEVGSVTPRPQPGNPRPRLFRLPEDRAVINRMGFNNDGMTAVASRLRQRRTGGIVGVNLGKNKETQDAATDYEKGVALLAPLAGYVVINVSSPNTPGLRALQDPALLTALARRVRAALNAAVPAGAPPLLLKIAPDLTPEDREDIARVALDEGLDGLIVSNTTIGRPEGLRSPHRDEAGGLSGEPLKALSMEVLRDMYALTQGRLPLIGVGGIASGADAYARIRAGASLVQLYTALVYEGPGLVARIKADLARLLRADGFSSLAEAVGCDHRRESP
ncbi:MAG: quinone-dependent dihydroorotate dehydrogenase [Alphaproteobacteria bacterium]|nr:quinone-dependent dihydroorotate dehydrogenase [Alphaproteobacteria bacterium]